MPLFYPEMKWTEAAAIPEVWLTAFQLLFQIAKAKSGETALIHAAASGVGTAML
jgi:tumor protein p53-inducible protein 3